MCALHLHHISERGLLPFGTSTSGKYMVNALLCTSGDCTSPLLSIYRCSKLTLSYHPEFIDTVTNLQDIFVLLWCLSCCSWPLYAFRGHRMSPDLGKMSVTYANMHIFCCHTDFHFHWKRLWFVSQLENLLQQVNSGQTPCLCVKQ